MPGLFDNSLLWPVAALLVGVTAGVMTWKVTPYFKFAYPSARVQAIGNPFVREKELSQFLECKSINSFKSSLNVYKDYNVEGLTASEIQSSLDEHFVETLRMVQKDSPKKLRGFYDAYLKLLDGLSVKLALKSKVLGEELKSASTVFPETRKILEVIKSVSVDELPSVLRERGFDEGVVEVLKSGGKDLLKLDATVDKSYIGGLRSAEVPREAKGVRDEFVLRLIDIKNIKNVLRAKRLGYSTEECENLFVGEGKEIAWWKFKELSRLDGLKDVVSSLQGTFYFPFLKKELEKHGEKEGVQPFENALDESLLKVVENLSIKNFPLFGPLLRFIVAKEFEIRNLKVIVKGVEEKLGVERIKTLLILEG